MTKKVFTVCTPCFNSSKFIIRLYQSLKNQTYKNFEWLVIDDCSTDNTVSLLRKIKKKSSFKIKIIVNKKNLMVSRCWNLGVKNANGLFFIGVGHDDMLVPTALETFSNTWNNLDTYKKKTLCGIMAQCINQHGNITPGLFPGAPCSANWFDMNNKVKGEKCFCYKTKILKQNNFSYVDSYVPENLTLLNISDKYDTYFINDPVRIYYIKQKNHQSLTDSFLKNKFIYPSGFREEKIQSLNRRWNKMLKNSCWSFFKTLIIYIKYSIYLKKNLAQTTKPLKIIFIKKLTTFLFHFILIIMKINKKKYDY